MNLIELPELAMRPLPGNISKEQSSVRSKFIHFQPALLEPIPDEQIPISPSRLDGRYRDTTYCIFYASKFAGPQYLANTEPTTLRAGLISLYAMV